MSDSTETIEAISPKQQMRDEMMAKLRALTPNDRLARSAQICARVLQSSIWQNARAIALFSPLRSEPEISFLQNSARSGGQTMMMIPPMLRVEADLELSETPDLILVPAIAFSRDGHRLGRGHGFYDRLLAGRAATAFKLGVCFSFQRLETVPVEPHDIVMDQVMTDSGDSAVF
jgi:5-formyltetrahydrofolate cyclo-ligase